MYQNLGSIGIGNAIDQADVCNTAPRVRESIRTSDLGLQAHIKRHCSALEMVFSAKWPATVDMNDAPERMLHLHLRSMVMVLMAGSLVWRC